MFSSSLSCCRRSLSCFGYKICSVFYPINDCIACIFSSSTNGVAYILSSSTNCITSILKCITNIAKNKCLARIINDLI